MNKLLTKIVGLSLGLSMAIGVGVAVGLNSKQAEPADAATVVTWSRVTSTSTLVTGGTFIFGYEATANSGVIVPMANTGSATTSANGMMYSGSTATSGGNGTITMSTLGDNGSKFEIIVAESTSTAGEITLSDGTNLIGNPGSSGKVKLYPSVGNRTSCSVSIGTNDVLTIKNVQSSTDYILQYNSSSPRFAFYTSNQKKLVAYQKVTSSTTDPTISLSSNSGTVKKDGTVSATVTYSDLTASLTATSNDTNVATVALASPVSSGSGTVVMTVTGAGAGTTTIDVESSGATKQTYSVTVYIEQEFTKITMLSKLVDGGHYLLAKTGTAEVMSTTQNDNNRGSTTVAGSNPFSTLTTNSLDASIVTISKGSDAYSEYYTIYDPVNEGYLYDPNTTNKNYLRTNSTIGGTAGTDYGYWSITFSDDHAIIANKGRSGYHIRFNSNLVADYSTEQTHIDLYLLTSELPSDTNIASFTMPSGTISFENLDSYVLTGTYSPANANETVTPTMAENSTGEVEFSEVELNSGTFTVTLTGKVAGSVGVVLTGDRSGVTGTKYVTVSNSSRIYDSGKLNKDSVATTLGDGVATSGVTWFTNDATMQDSEKEFNTSTDTRGVGLGSASAPIDTFVLTSDLFVGEDYKGDVAHLMSSLIINASVAKDGEATMVIRVDGTQVGSTQTLTAEATDYTFTPASPVAGHISIEIINSAAKAVYIGSIIVKGEALAERDSDVYYSIAKQLEAIDSCEIDSSSWSTFLATEDSYFEMTYEDIFDLAESDFSAITLWDHASEDPSSLKTSGYNAFFKYSYISSRFDPSSSAFVLPGFFSDETSTAVTIIAIISVISVSAIGGFFFLRKRKEQ